MDRFTQFCLRRRKEAIEDADAPRRPGVQGPSRRDHRQRHRRHQTFWYESIKASQIGNWTKTSPFFIPMLMANAAPAHISMAYGFRGPVFSVGERVRDRPTTRSAPRTTRRARRCAGDDHRRQRSDCISPLAVGGFCSMKAMSTRNDDPTRASRPFDKERDGFVLGEGAGILVLEEYEHAKARGAKIYCEVLGYGQSADAYDLVAVDPERRRRARWRSSARLQIGGHLAGRRRLHQRARHLDADRRSGRIARRSRKPSASTPKRSASARPNRCTATRSAARAASKASRRCWPCATDIMPPTINYEFPDPECTLDYVPNVARKAPVNVALSNSFGFGGHNSVIVFGKVR